MAVKTWKMGRDDGFEEYTKFINCVAHTNSGAGEPIDPIRAAAEEMVHKLKMGVINRPTLEEGYDIAEQAIRREVDAGIKRFCDRIRQGGK